MQLFIGSDHYGFHLEQDLIDFLRELGHTVESLSNTHYTPDDDYPDVAFAVAKKVSTIPESLGIVMCGSGGGVCVAANKVKGAYCVQAYTPEQAHYARKDDNANIIALGARYTDISTMKEILTSFISTSFETGGRHERRFHKIQAQELL